MESQYRDASKLDARIALHERFGTNPRRWQRWVFDRLALPPGADVLDLGCGPGYLWRKNLERVPEGWGITLADTSPGMLREAEHNVGFDHRFVPRLADARELPFGDGSFDAVVANHVLHLVPDLPRAISEISRVLKPGGALYAATNGWSQDLHQKLGRMMRVLDPTPAPDGPSGVLLAFNLRNGAGRLLEHFPDVSLRRYEDGLAVTQAKPLLDYLLSTTAAHAVAETLTGDEFRERVAELSRLVEHELASRGVIHIAKDAGLFVARR